tara:strand:+ start:4163 stop:4897 length:735 start_codon:yes stop_codon:yes gene_type:complete
MIKNIIFKKIKFFNFNKNNFDNIIKKRGLFLFPSGPGLSDLENNLPYHNALAKADFVFLDSGYFVLLLKILKNINVNKCSGYIFFKYFIDFLKKNRNIKILSVDPNKDLSNSNIKLFKKIRLNKSNLFNYISPLYNSKSIFDKKLIDKINKIKPKYILINIGGGTQEILGLYIKKKCKHKCTILCTGAAIAYFTGDQAPMNSFFDSFYLGWFVRIFFNPKRFLPRYLKTFKLFFLVLRNKVIIN